MWPLKNVSYPLNKGCLPQNLLGPLLNTLSRLAIKQAQSAITCSKLTIETLEQGVKYVLKLMIKTPERRHWRRSGIFIVNFEHISHLVLVFLLLTLSR